MIKSLDIENDDCLLVTNILFFHLVYKPILVKKGRKDTIPFSKFFLTINDDLMIGSLLKDELISDYSTFFYGLHPAPKNKKVVYVVTALAFDFVKTGLYCFTVSFISISATFEEISKSNLRMT